MEAIAWLLGGAILLGAALFAISARRAVQPAPSPNLGAATNVSPQALPPLHPPDRGQGHGWRVKLTDQQAAFAEAAIEFYGREFPGRRSLFSVDGQVLTMPDDQAIRSDFVHKGVWQVEIGLDKMKADGDITSARMASLRRSLLHLEHRVSDPEWYKGKRIA